MRKSLLVLCGVISVVGMATAGWAGTITILNAGFDDTNNHTANGWSIPSVPADQWTSNDFEAYPDGTISPPTMPQSAPNVFNLTNYVYFAGGHPDQPIFLYQATTHPIAAGDQYVLTWQTAIRADCTWTPIDYTVGFRPQGGTADATNVTVAAATLAPKGTWFEKQLTWTVPAGDTGIGSNLEIYIQSVAITTGSSWWQTTLDSFSLAYTPGTVTYLPGDADRNGTVDGADLNTVLSNYNATFTGDTWPFGDFDANGTVDGADLNTVLSNYNQHSSAAGAPGAPEPSTLLLAAAGLVGLLAYAWRRRR
jgi:hypothetical protein